MSKTLFELRVQAENGNEPTNLWVSNLDQEAMQHSYQWRYGYWPGEITVIETLTEIKGEQ